MVLLEDLSDPVPANRVVAATGSGAASAARYYIIQRGDTLYGLARRFYGNSSMWRAIARANRTVIQNPNQIPAGARIVLPIR